MKKYTLILSILSLIFIFHNPACATQDNDFSSFKAYCGSAVLNRAMQNLGVNADKAKNAIETLNSQADQNKGINSLYELKIAAQEAHLIAQAIKVINMGILDSLIKEGQLIASITGNRHFSLVKDISKGQITSYIPGLNQEQPTIPMPEFLEYWDNNVLLVVSSKGVNLDKYKGLYAPASDEELKKIFGGQTCSNCTGSGGNYGGAGGEGRANEGNGAADPKDAATDEPVVIRNGNLFLEVNDIAIPTRTLPLKLGRYYNSEVVSEIWGWIPEPCAGSWVIENGEYSGQGNRVTSDLKFKDFTLEVDMQTIEPGSHYSWEAGWINFRYTEDPNDPRKPRDCYYFLIHKDGKLELSKWKEGIQYWLWSSSSNYRPTNKNRIKIITQGANIIVYVNGNLAVNYTDSNPVLSEGRIALESYFSHSHFDNLSIISGAQIHSYDFNTDDNEFIFGYGWTHSYSLRIKEYPSHVTLYRENNHKEIYVPKGDGTYSSYPADYYTKLTKDASGFSLKTKYGIHYRFDLSGRLQFIEDRNLNRTTLAYSAIGGKTLLTSVIEPAGRKIILEYGANNMVSKVTDPQGNYLQYFYDSSGHLIKVIDRNGNATEYTYDVITHNLTELTDPEGNTYHYNYTYNDRVNDQVDPLGNTTTFDYLWDTVHVINKRGEIYKYNFDSHEFLQSIADPQNNMERTTNDENGNITNYYDKNANHTYFTYDGDGNRTGIYDAKGNWTKFTYEATYNQPTSFTDARGNVTAFSYDAKGNLTQALNPEGGVTTYAYNSYGQATSITDAKGNITQFTYDTYGNLATKTDAQGNITTYTYDILGRLIKITDALGNSIEYTYDKNGNLLSVKDPLSNITTYTYTKNDYLTSATDPLGNITTYTYDCFGNLLTVTDALGSITTYAYDTTNQMHLNKTNLLSITDAKRNITAYNYDSLDRLTTVTDATSQIYQFACDRQGNVTSRIDPNAQTTTYRYNVLNQLYRINYPDATFINYTIDNVGNITQMQDSTRITTYTYDKVSRLKSQVYPDATRLDYAYDLNGNRTILEISSFGIISYDYDSLNRLIKITHPDTKVTQFSYNRLALRTQLNYPNGAITTYSYDNASRLTQLINKDKTSQDISKFIYTYDNASRRTRIDLINGSINYSYDKLNQLLKESGTDGSTTNYTYNNLNQLTQSQGTAPTITYSYDKNGNLIQKVGATTETFTYDFENRLKTYISPTQNATYVYDGQGKRISKTVNGATTKYYYDGDEVILEKAGANSIYYLHGPRIDEIISDSRGYCYHADGLGSVVNLTDASGAKVTSYDYQAFGSIRSQSGSISNAWLFTGRQLDAETGLYNYRSRHYSPEIGRFLQRDPLGHSAGINLYTYCSNNPVNLIDPYGLCGTKPPWWISPIQRAISGIFGALDKPYRQYIGSSQWYTEARPFQFGRNIAQGIGVALSAMRVMEPWMRGNYSSIEQGQVVAAVRGIRFMVVTAASGWGAEGGALFGAKLGLLTGPYAPVVVPIAAAAGAVVFGSGADILTGWIEKQALKYGGLE